MPLQPGEIIDRYVIEALLGAGGMGEVYRARDTRLQRSVALKILHDVPDAAGGSKPSAGGPGRLLREARAAAALEHANVVSVFDVGHVDVPGSANGITYLAMELIRGSSLRAYIGDARITTGERLRWLADAARALGAAHRAGLVHRDVKPENVMVREDGAVKVLDFGIARRAQAMVDPSSSTEGAALATMTAKGVVVGTPMYMAPEQLRAEQIDGRADQFSWAVLAYEVLTGKSPWAIEEGAIALVAQILSSEPPPLATLVDVPEHVAKTIARALRKDRDARFPSMEMLVDALTGHAEGYAATLSSEPGKLLSGAPLAPPPAAKSKDGEAFASAPTEAVMTPPTSRGSTAKPAPPRGRVGRALAFGAIGVGVLALAGGVALRLRAPKSPGAASTRTSAEAGGCASNKECMAAHGGEPWICRADQRRCVPLQSEDCTVLADPGDLELDSTVWLGALFPLTGNPAESLKPDQQATDLARRDFAETLGRIGTARRLGVVSCDATADLGRAARHLAEDVHVPAVLLGIDSTAEIIDLVSKSFTPNDVLTMVSLNPSPLVTSLPPGPSGRLVYRSTYSTDELLAPTAAFVESVLEPRLPASRRGKLRLAFLHSKRLATRLFFDRLLTVLRFNGKPAIENGDDLRDVAFDDEERSYAAALEELRAFRPDVVLTRVSSEGVHGVIEPLEKTWPAGVPRPTFLLSSSLLNVVDFVATDASRRARYFGMDNVSSTTGNVQFTNHFNQAFNTRLSRTESPATSFDGFYALAYAVEALGNAPATGPSIARAFRRLSGGKTFVVGPESIFDAYRELLSGASIDLEGAAGHLELDEATGESSFDFSIVCAAPLLLPQAQAGASAHAVASHLVYSPKSGAYVGALSCP